MKSNLIRKPTKNELKPLEILVEVLACGCDFVQLLLMQNKYQLKQKPPFTLGGEACGRIIALGTDVKGLEMGDMVIGAGNGMFCEYKILNSLGVLKLDRDIDPIYAPSPYSYVTSLHALKYRAKLKAKKQKERLRKRGLLKVRTPGGRMKPIRRRSRNK